MAAAEEQGSRIGPRIAVVLTLLVAVLSIVTGVVNIGNPTSFGPLARYVPASVQQLAGFTGTLTGFVMLLSTFALRRGLRLAWYAAVVLLPVTGVQGLIQSSEFSIPLVVLSVVTIPALLMSRGRFDRSVDLTTSQLAAGIALVGVQLYGTAGAYALREQFDGINTLADAFWYTLVTASTVGYGDAVPDTQVAKVFGMSVVVLGTASFAIALGALLGPAIEARFARALGRMSESQLELLHDHVLVLGYGELTEPILGELEEGHVEFVVVTPEATVAGELADRGINVITADPSDEEPLLRAQIEDARAIVVATNDDAQDALSILTARELRPDARIVAAATDLANVRKLRRAGADTVVSPASIGGHLLVQSALGGENAETIADRILGKESPDYPNAEAEEFDDAGR